MGHFAEVLLVLSCGLSFVKSVQTCVQSLVGHLMWGFFQMLRWALSMSQAAGGCKISTTAIKLPVYIPSYTIMPPFVLLLGNSFISSTSHPTKG